MEPLQSTSALGQAHRVIMCQVHSSQECLGRSVSVPLRTTEQLVQGPAPPHPQAPSTPGKHTSRLGLNLCSQGAPSLPCSVLFWHESGFWAILEFLPTLPILPSSHKSQG